MIGDMSRYMNISTLVYTFLTLGDLSLEPDLIGVDEKAFLRENYYSLAQDAVTISEQCGILLAKLCKKQAVKLVKAKEYTYVMDLLEQAINTIACCSNFLP